MIKTAQPILLTLLCTITLLACGPVEIGGEPVGDPAEKVNPSAFTTFSGSMPACGKVMASFQGTMAYSNGKNTSTGYSCAGSGAYGLQYQCVELVMRHFKTTWGLRWWGNAKDLLNNAPKATVDVYKNGDGAHPPVAGDMIVWTKGTYGHVALVTGVSGSGVSIIEQNVKGSGSATLPYDGKSVGARWGSWVPVGWAHAKANTTGGGTPPPPPGPQPPPPPPPPAPDPDQVLCQKYGWISTCQGAGALLSCDQATQKAKQIACPNGCQKNALGTPDACKGATPPPPGPPPPPPPPPPPGGGPVSWSCNKSAWQGKQLWTCSGGARYRCTGGAPQKEACSRGCWSNSLGKDDQCISPAAASAWGCNQSSWQGKQLWTCKTGTSQMYRCEAGSPVLVSCPSGCKRNSLGQNDACY